jgi:hypothetical protein
MKYLKLFESIDGKYFEISEEQFYLKIRDYETPFNIDSILDIGSGLWMNFSDREVRIIRRLIGKKFKFSYSYKSTQIISHFLSFTKERGDKSLPLFDYKNGIEKEINVYKLDDEWFCIMYRDLVMPKEYQRRYYKCDQWDGLTDCLKEIIK